MRKFGTAFFFFFLSSLWESAFLCRKEEERGYWDKTDRLELMLTLPAQKQHQCFPREEGGKRKRKRNNSSPDRYRPFFPPGSISGKATGAKDKSLFYWFYFFTFARETILVITIKFFSMTEEERRGTFVTASTGPFCCHFHISSCFAFSHTGDWRKPLSLLSFSPVHIHPFTLIWKVKEGEEGREGSFKCMANIRPGIKEKESIGEVERGRQFIFISGEGMEGNGRGLSVCCAIYWSLPLARSPPSSFPPFLLWLFNFSSHFFFFLTISCLYESICFPLPFRSQSQNATAHPSSAPSKKSQKRSDTCFSAKKEGALFRILLLGRPRPDSF